MGVFGKQAIVALLVFVGVMVLSAPGYAQNVVYLVRHAEKAEGSNPSLTEAGMKRAEALAAFLHDKNVQTIYSTDYKRTLETANPAATQAGIDVKRYDPSNLPQMKAQLSLNSKPSLVVGHSNTTPRLFNLLTGLKHSDLEEHQYDRMYIVHIGKAGDVTGVVEYLEPRTP